MVLIVIFLYRERSSDRYLSLWRLRSTSQLRPCGTEFSSRSRRNWTAPLLPTWLRRRVSRELPCVKISKSSSPFFPKGFNCTKDENDAALKTLRRRAWQALRAKVGEQTADASILTKLRSTFEERFRYDDNGVPRVWKPEDDIDTAFRKARDQVCQLSIDLALVIANLHRSPRLSSSSLSIPTSRPKILLSKSRYRPSLETLPSPKANSISQPRSSFSLTRNSSISSLSSEEKQTRTTSKRRGVSSVVWHRFRYGFTACWSSWAGTRLWRCCSTRFISPCFSLVWLLRALLFQSTLKRHAF